MTDIKKYDRFDLLWASCLGWPIKTGYGGVMIRILIIAFVLFSTTTANAITPALHFREGFPVVLKDGGTPGPLSTRLDFTLGEKLSERFSLSAGVGLSTPNDSFKPSPRVVAGVALALAERWSAHLAAVYQHTVGYGGKDPADALGAIIGPTYTIANGLTLSLSAGAVKTLKGDWSMLFQPSLSISFL